MTTSTSDWKARVYSMIRSGDPEQVRKGFNAWAPSYDEDHQSLGGILLENFVELFCRHVPQGASPILDAGAGTGRLREALAPLGYSNFVGIDLS